MTQPAEPANPPSTEPAKRGGASALSRTQDHLKQLVYGGNDGIVTTFAIVAGFAGANAEGVAQIGTLAVLVFGLANLFADAVSMGLGEFLSMRSQNDLYHQRHAEQIRRIAADPATETDRMAGLLRERGLSPADAAAGAELMSTHPPLMADLTLSWGYGMAAPEDANPALNGLMTFLAFVVFGAVPLSPYFVLDASPTALLLSVAMTFFALVALGLLRWIATRDRLVRAVGETVSVGTVCALVAYFVGWIVGG